MHYWLEVAIPEQNDRETNETLQEVEYFLSGGVTKPKNLLQRGFTMCRRVVCSKCKHPTWAGCGRHIDSVRTVATVLLKYINVYVAFE